MKISPAESQVMDVLWRLERPMSSEDVADALADEQEWSHGTVRTLLTRLVKKKAAAAEKDGRRYLYSPLIARADYVHAESKSLVDRLFGGQVGPFFAHFAQREDLTAEDIAEIKRLVAELDNDD